MRVDQVLKIMGEPIGSNTQPIYGVKKEGQVYHFHDNVSKQLMAVFLGDKLMTASLSDREGKFSESKDIIPYNPNDFMPLQHRSKNWIYYIFGEHISVAEVFLTTELKPLKFQGRRTSQITPLYNP